MEGHLKFQKKQQVQLLDLEEIQFLRMKRINVGIINNKTKVIFQLKKAWIN
jgi:serine kinase of HPr protein (carbohydrate metabolism regulator)